MVPERNDAAEHGGTDARRARLTKDDVRALSDRNRAPSVSLVAPVQQDVGNGDVAGRQPCVDTFQGPEPASASIRNVTVAPAEH